MDGFIAIWFFLFEGRAADLSVFDPFDRNQCILLVISKKVLTNDRTEWI